MDQHGQKTGGRQAGTPNRRTLEVQDKLEALGCDPITGMAQLAMDPATDMPIRARLYAELAQYIAPKRKAIEMSGALDQGDVWEQLVAAIKSGKRI